MSNTSSKVIGMVLTLGLTGMAIGFMIAMAEESHVVHDPTPVFGIVAGAAVFAVLLRGPVGKAIAKMLEGQSVPDDHVMERLDHMEDRLAEFGAEQMRVAELEERVDFTERLLSQREPARELRQPEG